jgi:hypothetical protein
MKEDPMRAWDKPDLPRLSRDNASELKVLGIESISLIPVDFPLTSKQIIIRDATASGQSYLAPDLARLLRCFGPRPVIWTSKQQ